MYLFLSFLSKKKVFSSTSFLSIRASRYSRTFGKCSSWYICSADSSIVRYKEIKNFYIVFNSFKQIACIEILNYA